jgi:nucleoside-diphosphate kinase
MTELTLLLIKPNATRKHHIGDILAIVEKHGFRIKKLKSFTFDLPLATQFYEEHIGKEFFERLVTFMTSGMIVAALLEKDEAVYHLRELIGDTNPETRKMGSIRYLYADTYTENAVHASDTHDHALREIALIFPENQT